MPLPWPGSKDSTTKNFKNHPKNINLWWTPWFRWVPGRKRVLRTTLELPVLARKPSVRYYSTTYRSTSDFTKTIAAHRPQVFIRRGITCGQSTLVDQACEAPFETEYWKLQISHSKTWIGMIFEAHVEFWQGEIKANHGIQRFRTFKMFKDFQILDPRWTKILHRRKGYRPPRAEISASACRNHAIRKVPDALHRSDTDWWVKFAKNVLENSMCTAGCPNWGSP